MIELGQIIIQVLEKRKMWRRYRQYLIIDQWEQIVGKNIAAVTSAKRIDRKILWVNVSGSTWAYHLTLLKPDLINKINKYADENIIQDIFFRIKTDDR